MGPQQDQQHGLHGSALAASAAATGPPATDEHAVICGAKATARKHIKGLLKHLSAQAMEHESREIARAILSSPAFTSASTVGVYVHCDKLREVDTTAILQAALAAGQRCYVPLVEDKSSNMSLLHLDDLSALVSVPPFGIREPTRSYADGTPREDVLESRVHLDTLLMPGLGFDVTGRRLGRGGGYYDKMLARLQQQAAEAGKQPPLLVALAYSVQMIEEVPVDEHDKPVDVLVTAAGVMRCTERGRREWT